jgi:hypothetical protein
MSVRHNASAFALTTLLALAGAALAQEAAPPPAEKGTLTPMMDGQIKSMQEMHNRMLAAKLPQEQQVLMTDQMKSMHNGMAMMDQMKIANGMPGATPSPEMMNKRMDMMQTMMQIMLDHEAVQSPAATK